MVQKTTRNTPAKRKGQASKATVRKAMLKAGAAPAPLLAAARKRNGSKANAAAVRDAVKPWTAAEIAEAFRRWRDADPDPKGELHYVNPFTLLIAVSFSAQATDSGVNKATRPLFAKVDTPQKMVALGEERLRDAIKSIGFFNVKARNAIALSRKLIADFGGEVPRDREALQGLPGVGRKTANVVLNIAFGEPTMAVDTHVFRVSNRTGLAPGKDVQAVEARLERVIPDEFKVHAHHWLILHGRYVCKAVRPLCESCLINDLCHWPGKAAFLDGAKPARPKVSAPATR
ncbi:MAG: endonuclease III [Variibacter sp.]